jgi:hypothetical protein
MHARLPDGTQADAQTNVPKGLEEPRRRVAGWRWRVVGGIAGPFILLLAQEEINQLNFLTMRVNKNLYFSFWPGHVSICPPIPF